MKGKKLLLVLGVILLVIILIAAFSGGGNSTATTASDNDNSVQSNTKEWVEVARLKGSGDKKSDTFTYEGGKARLRYDFKSDEYGALLIYVVKDGKDVMEDGGLPEVTLDGAEEGESSLSHLKKGDYYLNVISANGTWDVIVEVLK